MKATTKDVTKVWTDCPECAYKHLTAAYALVSDPLIEKYPVPAYEVLISRAWISFCESRSGYPGNLALAEGCLAAAETLTTAMHADELRRIRLSRSDHMHWDRLLTCYIGHTVAGVKRDPRWGLAQGHICEAFRECPALAEDFSTLEDADPDTLVDAIQWVKTTYELEGGRNDWAE